MSDALAVAAALREAIAQERSEAVKACLAEREAWARLVKAQSALSCDGPGCDCAAAKAHEAAKQALRDLGVDVDDLLGEPR